MSPEDHHGNLSCSFCGKGLRDVRKLISGPTVYICDQCIGLCNDILAEEAAGGSQRIGVLGQHANRAVVLARNLAEACDRAVELPRPVAERARALAEEIELVTLPDAESRLILAEYAKSVAVNARHFAKACDAAELPRRLAERARALFVEIEALVGPCDER